MTVADHVEHEPTDSYAEDNQRLDPQAAAELAQELTLVARSMFAQLLPGTAAHAISGVPGVDRRSETDPTAPVAAAADSVPDGVPLHPFVPVPSDLAPPAQADVPAPAAVAIPVPGMPTAAPSAAAVPGSVELPAVPATGDSAMPIVPATPVGIAVPVPVAIPMPAFGQPEPQEEVGAEPSTLATAKPEHHSLAMLEEIGFLDE